MASYFPTPTQLIAIQRNPNQSLALEMLWANQYGTLSICPHCQRKAKFYRIASRQSYSCGQCGRHISPQAGTIFEHSHTPLATWFSVIHDLYISGGQMSAQELQRKYKVTYKTAWRMKDLICQEMRLTKGYNYTYSSKRNGRFYQLERGL